MQDLISGLQTDGIWTKLDRLWIFAQATQASALVDLVASATATALNSPTFTVNVGYKGNGSTQDISCNFIASTDAVRWTQNSACFFAWSNTAGADAGVLAGARGGGGAIDNTRIFPEYSGDSKIHFGMNGDATGTGPIASTGPTGLYLVNRTDSATITVDINGSQFSSDSVTSIALPNVSAYALSESDLNLSARQCCCIGFGAGLSGADRTNLYTRLRTYMTAVGVP